MAVGGIEGLLSEKIILCFFNGILHVIMKEMHKFQVKESRSISYEPVRGMNFNIWAF